MTEQQRRYIHQQNLRRQTLLAAYGVGHCEDLPSEPQIQWGDGHFVLELSNGTTLDLTFNTTRDYYANGRTSFLKIETKYVIFSSYGTTTFGDSSVLERRYTGKLGSYNFTLTYVPLA